MKYLPAYWLRTGPFYLLAIIVFFQVKNNVFFWDTIQLGAKQASWFYEQGFRYWLLPEEIDSGHPPFFGMYLALLWKLLGKSLTVSHLAMLPFLFGIIHFATRLGERLAPLWSTPFLLLLLSVDATFAAQAILISPDLVLFFGFLMGLESVFSRRWHPLSLAALILAMISLRGMMIVVVLYLFDLGQTFLEEKQQRDLRTWGAVLFRSALPYVPSGVFALAFLFYHYFQTGWIGYHVGSPWAPSFERVDAGGFLYNIGILGWRLLDFGRVFAWLIIMGLLWQVWKKSAGSLLLQKLLLLLGLTLLLLSPSLLLHRHLLLHRYLLPVYLSGTFLLYYLLFGASLIRMRWQYGLYTLALLGLLTGNRWIYPRQIAQGWDATLAHLPFYDLRSRMLEYMDNQKITYQEVGTGFPMIGPLKYRDLSGRETGFVGKNPNRQSLILYSNISNDFTDEELQQLEHSWKVRYRIERGGVEIVLYEKAER